MADIKTEIYIQVQSLAVKREPLPPSTPLTWNDSAQTNPLTSTEAISMAETALKEERYYDAHWLATLGGELAGSGSAQSARAARIASEAWNAVSTLEPNSQQVEAYRIFNLKKNAYSALISNDPIQAYYLFLELLSLAPTDPEARHYLALSEEELSKMAFFIDEMELMDNPEGAIFSLPRSYGQASNGSVTSEDGRMVMRFSSLSVFLDAAFGYGLEILTFDEAGRLQWSIEAPYAKILPVSKETGAHVVVLMHALDRVDGTRQWKPNNQSFGATAPQNAQLTLDLSWEDFTLLAKIRRGQDRLNIGELITASKIAPEYGYLPQIYEAELISRLAEPILFLPFIMLILTIGWRYRALKKPRIIWVPMLGVLPLVFSGVTHLGRTFLDNISVLAVIYVGYSFAFFLLGAAALLLFFISLIILAYQHS